MMYKNAVKPYDDKILTQLNYSQITVADLRQAYNKALQTSNTRLRQYSSGKPNQTWHKSIQISNKTNTWPFTS